MADINKIVDGGYCVGCGACSLITENTIEMGFNEIGLYQPSFVSDEIYSENFRKKFKLVCPFTGEGLSEDDIAENLYGKKCLHDNSIGFYGSLYAGYSATGAFRERGTSGGIVSWLLAEMLRTGLVDAVIHVKKTVGNGATLFRYAISRSEDEILEGAKSRYYPVEMSKVLEEVKKVAGRYVFVGLPCFVKAVRRLADNDPLLGDRIAYCVGLVCGHLKSSAFAECLGWQIGVTPDLIRDVDFRVKIAGMPASQYGVRVRGDGKDLTAPIRQLMGCNWGHNLFRYPACDFCDDLFAETADVSVGDAWLAEYETDSKGTSIVVVRNPILKHLFEDAVKEGALCLHTIASNRIGDSQIGGIRDRREGLSYRLWLRKKNNAWAPRRRVAPEKKGIPLRRRRLYRLRTKIGLQSHYVWRDAKLSGSLEPFIDFYRQSNSRYIKLYFSLSRRFIYSLSELSKKIKIKTWLPK